MLEKPDLPDAPLIACLQDDYGLRAAQLTFLPLGADANTAVYRVVADDATPYFLKLRRGVFDEMAVAIPRVLSDHGIAQVIPPLETRTDHLWTRLDPYTLVLYPFIAGRDGYEVALSPRQWAEFGVALKGIHADDVPPAYRARIPHEDYAPLFRQRVREFLALAQDATYDDPVAAEMAAVLRGRRDEITYMLDRTEQLGDSLRARSLEYVLCHGDIHPGNVHIAYDGRLYIVDWDTLIFAPKEHDLMFAVGSGDPAHPTRAETWFHQGYGPTQIDLPALAYYRYERVIEDIAAFGEQLLITNAGGKDREQGLQYFLSQFLPNETVERARRSDQLLRSG
jgi:spectinomycin phosphotransferase